MPSVSSYKVPRDREFLVISLVGSAVFMVQGDCYLPRGAFPSLPSNAGALRQSFVKLGCACCKAGRLASHTLAISLLMGP